MLTHKEILKYKKVFTEKDLATATLFKILSETNRFRIFLLLTRFPKFSIGSIAKILNISLPLASQHVRLMTHTHLLQKTRDGKKVYICLVRNAPLVRKIKKMFIHP